MKSRQTHRISNLMSSYLIISKHMYFHKNMFVWNIKSDQHDIHIQNGKQILLCLRFVYAVLVSVSLSVFEQQI